MNLYIDVHAMWKYQIRYWIIRFYKISIVMAINQIRQDLFFIELKIEAGKNRLKLKSLCRRGIGMNTRPNNTGFHAPYFVFSSRSGHGIFYIVINVYLRNM
jgi:hypothetical protein